MRAIANLDDRTRNKIVHRNNADENFDHLKIECRTKDKHNQHEGFGDPLFNMMKSISFEGYTGHIKFNEYGERVNFTLNVYQVTMNKLPRNVNEKASFLFEKHDSK